MVNQSLIVERSGILRHLFLLVMAIGFCLISGCEVDSFFDPSRTGRFEFTPTTIPILDRIDVIEADEERWARTTGVRSDDLLPSDLTYYMAAGDIITIEIFELHIEGQWARMTRRIDAGGFLRVPELGDIAAAGLMAQELEDVLRDRLAKEIIQNPQVDVVVEEFSAFTYTAYGMLQSPGVYTLRNPDLRLLDMLAIAGGVPRTTKKVYVVRELALSQEVKPSWEGGPRPDMPSRPGDDQIDIDELIKQLENKDSRPRPGDSRQFQQTPVDIEDLDPIQIAQPPVVDIEEVDPTKRQDAFRYDPEKDEWKGPELMLERVIEIPYKRLSRGDSSYNIVIRPNDRIYVEGAEVGVIYIDGEVNRPGVYNLPESGQFTLSRLIAAAGGLGPLAIPERVDLTRVVRENREATIRLNLAAIRQRTEPDILLKPDDHIIIGTSWIAAPLAVMRNGFRSTYGFGFLLDRNFGNDVFGAPPVNFVNR